MLHPHLASLVGSESFADVKFINLPDGGPPVFAHRLLLCSGASGYFSALLAGGFAEAQHSGMLELTLPGDGWTRATLLQVLCFLYTGAEPSCVLDEVPDAGALMQILDVADALTIEPLRRSCESKLAQAVDLEQVVQVLLLADAKSCHALYRYCLHFLHQNFGPLRRCAVDLPPPPALTALSGYEHLHERLLHDVEWAVYGTTSKAGQTDVSEPAMPAGLARWQALAAEEGVAMSAPLVQRLKMMESIAQKAGRELTEASVRTFLQKSHATASLG